MEGGRVYSKIKVNGGKGLSDGKTVEVDDGERCQ